MPKLIFATCFDATFQPGGLALIKSIRKFYSKDEAEIIVFTEERPCGDAFIKLCGQLGVEAKQMNLIPSREMMLKAKAWVTKYAMSKCAFDDMVVHIDADAFLLAKIDAVLDKMQPDSVMAWPDLGTPGLLDYRLMFGQDISPEQDRLFHFNAGVVCYNVGDASWKVINDFNAAVNDPYIWACLRNDQFILRNCVARSAWASFIMHPDAQHFNPIGKCADDLKLDNQNRWINVRSGAQQFIWHGCGSGLPWLPKERGGCEEPSIKEAFKWVQE
jgi:hypothetical protein